jgi:serine/threonine protein phosphatase PrpC
MSTDHKPENSEESERIAKAGGSISYGRVNGNLNLSRSLADFEYKRNTELKPEEQMITANPEIKSVPITEEDEFLVLACDGIWDMLSSQE